MTNPLDSVQWIHGALDCGTNTDPLIQIHEYDEDTFVLRLSKCFSYEGNFIYLLFGNDRAIIFDTGGPPGEQSHGQVMPIRAAVDAIIARWLERRDLEAIDLVVAHTHGHGDHGFWDGQFEQRPRTRIVRPTLQSVKLFFGLADWPEGEAAFDLGGRTLTIFPIPGHETSHIAIYDPRTKALLTGDTLYPGLLTVQDWPAFRRSAARMAQFARQHEIAMVLGNHIEMMSMPRRLYRIGTIYQPDEHVLPLAAAHIEELHLACEAMGDSPRVDIHDDFVIGA